MIRLISAFLFALTLFAGAYTAFWSYSTDQASSRLKATLAEAFSGSVKYTGLKREYDLTHVNLNLEGLEIRTTPDSAGQSMVYVLGNVNFVSDFFGKYKMEINLPKNQVVHILQNNKPVKTYSVQMEKGKIMLFPEQGENTLSWLVTIVRDGAKEVLRMGVGDIFFKENSINLLFKNLKLDLITGAKPTNLQTWIMKVEFNGLPSIQNMLIPILGNPTKNTIKKVTKNAVIFAKNNNANLRLIDWITRNNNKSFSANADIELDKRVRFWGSVNTVVSNQDVFKNFLYNSHLLSTEDSEESEFNLTRLFARDSQAPFSYKINIRQGDVSINTLQMGIVSPVIEMLDL